MVSLYSVTMSVNETDNSQLALPERERGRPITSANARELQRKGAETKRRNRAERQERAMELKALASLTPREPLRLELQDRYGEMADNLDEALAAGNGEGGSSVL